MTENYQIANRIPGVTAAMVLVCLFLFPTTAVAWQTDRLQVADTSSPRDTLRSFIESGNELHRLIQKDKYLDRNYPEHNRIADRMLDCLDMSETAEFARDERAAEVAVCLKEVLDREQLPDWDQIPDTVEIEAAGGVEKLSVWRIPGTRVTISRVAAGPQKHEYLFSPGTVDRAVEYYKSIEPEPYRTTGPPVSQGFYDWYYTVPGHPGIAALVDRLPERFRKHRILGVASWKWPALVLAIFMALGLMILLWRTQWAIGNRVREHRIFLYCLTLVFPVMAALVPPGFNILVQDYLSIRGTTLYVLSFLANLTMVLAGFVLVFSISNRIGEAIIASPRINPHGLNAQLIRILSKLLSLVGSITLFVVGGQFLGVPIGTLLASAGIFGAAMALASQDILKSLFGTMTLLADKPFRVGDFIKIGEYEGTVEDIGLRSTRLRLLAGHITQIPNDQLASQDVENFSHRKFILRRSTIHIPLDTSREKVEKAVDIIRSKLENRAEMSADRQPVVVLDEFGPDSFRIRYWFWFSGTSIWEFRDFYSRLNQDIFREFEQQGVQYSLPFRHSFWKHDAEQGPLDITIQNGEIGAGPQRSGSGRV